MEREITEPKIIQNPHGYFDGAVLDHAPAVTASSFSENVFVAEPNVLRMERTEEEKQRRRARRNEVEISSRKFSGNLDGLDEYRKAYFEKHPKKAKSVNITNATEERTIGCIHGKESILISPIIEWTVRDVWEFLNDVMQMPHCELYDMGWHRIGCLGCPMSSPRQKRIENEMFPHVKRNWIKAIKTIRNGGGITQHDYCPPNTSTKRDTEPTDNSARLSNKRENRGLWAGFQVARRLTA